LVNVSRSDCASRGVAEVIADDGEIERENILITGTSQGLVRELGLSFAREGVAGLSLVARHRPSSADAQLRYVAL